MTLFSVVHMTHGGRVKTGPGPGRQLSRMCNQKLAQTPESPLPIHRESALDAN